MSIVTFTKPQSHNSLADWECQIHSVRNDADSRSQDAMKKRNEARQLRNETTIRTKWDTYLNDIRLADRVNEIKEWHRVLGRCLHDVEHEVCVLTDEKAKLEASLAEVTMDFTVLNECLTLRDTRDLPDLVNDGVYCEFMNELRVLEAIKNALTINAQACWEQLNRLKEARFLLRLDLFNKEDVITADEQNLALHIESSSITYKPDPLRQPSNMLTYAGWLESMRVNKAKGENEVAASEKLRQTLETLRMRSKNDIDAQHDASDYALRNRVYEMQRARNELEWQRKKSLDEMERVRKEICSMEEAIRTKVASQMLAETRLENRLMRPSPELVRDDPHAGLADEVLTLRQTNNDLTDRTNKLKAIYNGLENLVVRLDYDIDCKQRAINLDLACLDVRKKLYSRSRAKHPSQTDRNVQLVRMEDEIPPE